MCFACGLLCDVVCCCTVCPCLFVLVRVFCVLMCLCGLFVSSCVMLYVFFVSPKEACHCASFVVVSVVCVCFGVHAWACFDVSVCCV